MSGIERLLVELSDDQLDTLAAGGVVSVAGDSREIVVGGSESGVREAARETADQVVENPERQSTAAATVPGSWRWSPADAPVDETRPGTVSVAAAAANRVRLRVRPEERAHESVGDDATAYLEPAAARQLADVVDPEQTDVSRASMWTEASNTQTRVVVDESQSGGLIVSVESDPSGHVVLPDDGGETAPRGSLREALVDAAEELIDS